MSFVHPIVVGHFSEPRRLHPGRPVCTFSIDMARATRMIRELPSKVADQVSLRDGFVYCIWLGSDHDDEILSFAKALADAELCLVIELTQREILYPMTEKNRIGKSFE